MTDTRIIKKYPNRRLYDTEESRYITLADIRQLVIDSIEFKVVDKQSDADITHQILLQVIAEQESHGAPILTKDLLKTLIRSYNAEMQGMVGKYLDQSLKLFMTQQRDLRERIKGVVGKDPVEVVHGIAEKNYQRFRSLQDEVFRVLGNPTAKFRKDRDDDA